MNFLDLPPEIRLKIYSLLLDLSQYRSGYKRIKHLISQLPRSSEPLSVPGVTLPRFYVTRYTPSILLLNRKITTEALSVLYNTELTLEGTPGTYFVLRQMDIAEFISETLLQRMRYVVLRLGRPEKFFVLNLLDIWGRRNDLQRLVVYIPADRYPEWNWGIVEDRVCFPPFLKSFMLMCVQLAIFAHAEGIPLDMRPVDNPLKNGK
jgi:hypothetical protein